MRELQQSLGPNEQTTRTENKGSHDRVGRRASTTGQTYVSMHAVHGSMTLVADEIERNRKT